MRVHIHSTPYAKDDKFDISWRDDDLGPFTIRRQQSKRCLDGDRDDPRD